MLCPHCSVEIHFTPSEPKNVISLMDKMEAPHSIGVMDDPAGDEQIFRGGYCPRCHKHIVVHYVKAGKDASGRPIPRGIIQESFVGIVYPKRWSKKQMAPEIPIEFVKDFHEAACIIVDSPKSTAALCRRLLQRVFHEHFKIKKKDLFHEIDDYISVENPPADIADQLHAVRNVGNMAAHPLEDRAAGTIVDVEPGEAEWLLELIDTLLDHIFVQPERAAARKANLNAKLTAIGKPTMK